MAIPEYTPQDRGLLNNYGISNFYNAAANNDFMRTNLFRIISLGGVRFTANELLYLTSTTLPGRAITNIQVPFMGLVFNVPGTANYPNSGAWNVSFRVPQNLSIRRKFEQWTRDVFNDIDSSGSYSIPSADASNSVILTLIDKVGTPIRTYTLYGAYCQSVGDVNMDITTSGEVMVQQATLAYQYWQLSNNP
jgi:hypothetical protein